MKVTIIHHFKYFVYFVIDQFSAIIMFIVIRVIHLHCFVGDFELSWICSIIILMQSSKLLTLIVLPRGSYLDFCMTICFLIQRIEH